MKIFISEKYQTWKKAGRLQLRSAGRRVPRKRGDDHRRHRWVNRIRSQKASTV